MSYNSQAEEQFLPLDSSIKSSSGKAYSTNIANRSDSLYGQQSEAFFLISKISELEKNYIQLEKKYVRKIKQLKQQLSQKHKAQSTLNQELFSLSKQYEQHKSQIQKISSDIKKSLEQTLQKQQKQSKLKSVSPKNHANNSPKRLIKKSLQMVKKQVKKQILAKPNQILNQVNTTVSSQRNQRKVHTTQELEQKQKKQLKALEDNLNISHENSLNSSNQIKNGRKLLYSPSNNTNGPSPKKKLLFNSSKELDLFSKPAEKKIALLGNNPSPKARRLIISPLQKSKQIRLNQNKNTKQQLKHQLPVIQQRPIKPVKQINHQKVNLSGTIHPPQSPAGRKKAPSPEAIGFFRKKINSNITTLKKIQHQSVQEQSLKAEKQKQQINQQTNVRGKQSKQQQEVNELKKQSKQIKSSNKQIQNQKLLKKPAKSPAQSSKNIKISPEGKFSPNRKYIQNSPSHKNVQIGIGQKPKLFTSMRQKLDDNIFK